MSSSPQTCSENAAFASPAHATPMDNSGLHSLVEAATALTQLVSSVPPASPQTHRVASVPHMRCVSEDEAFSNSVASLPSKSHKREAKRPPKATGRPEFFPLRLMRLLSDRSIGSVVTWLPHGRSFVILRPDVFAERVLPAYFPESLSDSPGRGGHPGRSAAKYPSFTRKLNRWGFRQVARGPDAGAFHHRLFRRDSPDLCLKMECQKNRAAAARGADMSAAKNAGAADGAPRHTRAPRVPLKKRKVPLSSTSEPTATNSAVPASSVASSSGMGETKNKLPFVEATQKHLSQAMVNELLENAQRAMAQLQQVQGRQRSQYMPLPAAGTVPAPQKPGYEPGLHVPVISTAGPLLCQASLTKEAPSNGHTIAAQLRSAEKHRSLLYKAFLEAKSA